MEKRRRWSVRDGDEKDLGGILSLRRIVFGEMEKDKLSPEFWKWEFNEGPDGKALIYLAEDGDQIVGHFADIPRRFSVQGEILLGTLSVDLMVHPDYRRLGIFSQMGRHAIRRVKEEEGRFMTSYPIRRETIRGFKKMGWKDMGKLPVLVYPIRFRGIVNRYLHFSPLSFLLGGAAGFFYRLLSGSRKRRRETIEIDEVLQSDEAFDQFWEKALSSSPILGVRNQSFFRWRYFRHPARTYTVYRALKGKEMRGYIVLRKVELLKFNSAAIVDLLALDESTLTTLVEKGIEYGQRQEADLLASMLPRKHPYSRILRKMGFLPSLKTFLLMVYPHGREEHLLSSGNWYVNWGDTDVM